MLAALMALALAMAPAVVGAGEAAGYGGETAAAEIASGPPKTRGVRATCTFSLDNRGESGR